MLALCAVVVIVAMLPGRRVYSDANNCVGLGLASLGMTEHHGGHCEPSYTKVERTEPAGGWPAIVVACVVALAAGILYRKPKRSTALLFWLWCGLSIGLAMALTIDFSFFDHVVTLWPQELLGFVFGMIGVLVFAAPIVAFATREKAGDPLPVASTSGDMR